MKNNKVLVVDDDPLAFEIIKGTLKDGFSLFHAADGKEGLELYARHDPFLILLDIEMPGMDGFAMCEALRANRDIRQPYIIFVSAHNTTEERLRAYASGGDDFILKPLSPKEVQVKTRMASEAQDDIENLRVSAEDAISAANSALSEIGSLGVVVKLLRQLFACQQAHEVVNALLGAIKEMELKGVVQSKLGSTPFILNTEGRSSQMEQVLLDGIASDERDVVDYGTRTAFNYPGLLLLVKNMPVEGDEQRERYRNLIAQMAEGASQRLGAMQDTPQEAPHADAQDTLRHYHSDVLAILGDMRRSLTDIAHEMLLSPDQEDTLLEVMNDTTRRINHSLQAITRR